MLLPDCHDVFDTEYSLLVCARSVTFGTFCFATLVATVYAFQRILPIFLSSQWYLTNLNMLALTGIQMALLVYECFILNSPKILVLAKYFRCVQIAISCVLYGKSAGDLVNRTKLVRGGEDKMPCVGDNDADRTLLLLLDSFITC